MSCCAFFIASVVLTLPDSFTQFDGYSYFELDRILNVDYTVANLIQYVISPVTRHIYTLIFIHTSHYRSTSSYFNI
jgi:hypothetical protein